MSNDLRACWYRTTTWEWKGNKRIATKTNQLQGRFHCWSMDHEELSDGVGHYPVAIVEDSRTGAVVTVPVSDICFGSEPDFSE